MPRDKRLYMTFPIDFWQHPKIELLSDAAFRTFVEMNGYSRMQDLDGRIPAAIAHRRWTRKSLVELTASHPERPVVLREGDDYVLRDYAEHQDTRSDREERARRAQENGRRGGRPRRNQPETNPVTNSDSGSVPNGNQRETQSKAEIETETDIGANAPSSEAANAATRPEWIALLDERPELDRLLSLLDDEMRRNGNMPTPRNQRTRKNVDAARLLLDRDARTVEQVEAAIRWCQADEFWRANILSMSKLRAKYDQLRLAAQRAQRPANQRQTPDDRLREGIDRGARLQALVDSGKELTA